MDVWVNGVMAGEKAGWGDGWMDVEGWMCRWMEQGGEGWVCGLIWDMLGEEAMEGIDGWMGGRVDNEWMKGRIDRWKGGWTDGPIYERMDG